jgi:Fe-S oxidoreductase
VTTTYDPKHGAYYDEADMRAELTRVYDLCHGCRMCFNLCPSFPTMFDLIDAKDQVVEDLTDDEQDRVVDECYQCKLCYVKCPYIPPHDWNLDFPRLMLRAAAVRNKRGERWLRSQVASQVLGRPDLLGRVASATAPLTNRALGTPGTIVRRVMEKTVGIAAERVLSPYARERFTTWFKKRARPAEADSQASVALFPTCMVEYQNPAIGKDTVKVYERNRVDVAVPEGLMCCGAPWLHSGDFDSFLKNARHNVAKLAPAVRTGRDVVVPQPTCGYVLKRDYPEYLGGEDAELVGSRTYDASEYLMRLHRGEGTTLDTDFTGEVPEQVQYHVPCHLQAHNIGLKSRDLMKQTGTKITLVNKCSGIDGTWGLRAENYDLARKVAEPLGKAIEDAAAKGAEVITGDCHLANGAIVEETGRVPVHPLQFIARAYGIPEE